jgi:hypothetical protein
LDAGDALLAELASVALPKSLLAVLAHPARPISAANTAIAGSDFMVVRFMWIPFSVWLIEFAYRPLRIRGARREAVAGPFVLHYA